MKILCILFLILFSGITALADPPIEGMKACTVRIICKGPMGVSGTGSGVLVGNGSYVVTNNHVVDCVDKGYELVVIQSKEQRLGASVLWKSEDKDLAVIQMNGTVGGAVPAFTTSEQVHKVLPSLRFDEHMLPAIFLESIISKQKPENCRIMHCRIACFFHR